MIGIVEFLTARLDEREAAIRDNVEWWWENFDRIEVHISSGIVTGGESYVGPFLAPAAVLADVAAKREIVKQYVAAVAAEEQAREQVHFWQLQAARESLERVVEALTLPYADRSGYKETWLT